MTIFLGLSSLHSQSHFLCDNQITYQDRLLQNHNQPTMIKYQIG